MKTVALGEIVDFYSGGTPSKSKPAYWQGDIPWFSAKDMKRQRLTNSANQIADEVFRSTSLRKLPAGTIAMVVRGMILAHTVPISILDVDAAINQDLKALLPKREVDTSFLAAMLRAQHATILSQVSTAAHGTKKLEARVLENLQIPFPPLPEQRRIAAILDHADALRAKRRQLLARLHDLTQSIFHDMFGHDDWPISTLDDVTTISGEYGANVPSVEMTNGLPRYVRITDITDEGTLAGEIRAPGGASATWDRYRLEDGDLLFARSGATVGKTYRHRSEDGPCIFAGYLIRYRPDTEVVDPDYLFALTKTPAYRAWVKARQNVVAQPNINAKQYGRELPIAVPPLLLQRQFTDRVDVINAQRQVLQRALAADDELFTSLQSRAFRGEL